MVSHKRQACSLDGYVEENGDCNDLQAQSYPGAVEVCDNFDNDCNAN